MRGGYRPGAGRPKGSVNGQRSPPGIKRQMQAVPPRRKPEDYTGTSWLRHVVNDPNASDIRRDRAAAVLAGIENRREAKPGKKVQAQVSAKWSGYGTEWWRLLHSDEKRAELEAELAADPELREMVEAQAAEARARERALDAGRAPHRPPTQTEPPPPRTIDDVLAERNKDLPPPDWGDDLKFTPYRHRCPTSAPMRQHG